MDDLENAAIKTMSRRDHHFLRYFGSNLQILRDSLALRFESSALARLDALIAELRTEVVAAIHDESGADCPTPSVDSEGWSGGTLQTRIAPDGAIEARLNPQSVFRGTTVRVVGNFHTTHGGKFG